MVYPVVHLSRILQWSTQCTALGATIPTDCRGERPQSRRGYPPSPAQQACQQVPCKQRPRFILLCQVHRASPLSISPAPTVAGAARSVAHRARGSMRAASRARFSATRSTWTGKQRGGSDGKKQDRKKGEGRAVKARGRRGGLY